VMASRFMRGEQLDGASPGALMLQMGDVEVSTSLHQSRPDKERESLFDEIEPLAEGFLGEWMLRHGAYKSHTTGQLMREQRQLQILFESRYASLARLVGFMVIFHEMGRRVEAFWRLFSLGSLFSLGYDMSRTHSILRVASTASPVSGAEVRGKILELSYWADAVRASNYIKRTLRWQWGKRQHDAKMMLRTAEQSVALAMRDTTGLRQLSPDGGSPSVSRKTVQSVSAEMSASTKGKNGKDGKDFMVEATAFKKV